MRDHVNAASAALERVIAAFGRGADRDPGDTIYDSSSVPLVDIALIAHACLRQRGERLRRLEQSEHTWLMLSESAALRRHILKSMVTVERALSEALGVRARLTNMHNLDVSLACRVAYQRYIREIQSIGECVDRGALPMVAALRESAKSVATLLGDEVHEHLRADDRRELRSLQLRVASAVQNPRDELSIRRLWMDICASAERYERVHERSELLEHDLELLARLLGDGSRPLRVDESMRARLAVLEGRDRGLDRLLGARRCTEPELRASLIEVHDQLARRLGRAPLTPLAAGLGELMEVCAW